MTNLDDTDLATICGGASGSPTPEQQAEFKDLAKSYCPDTYARYRNAPQITRRMGERCLDEAGLGMFKGSLDRYFGPRT